MNEERSILLIKSFWLVSCQKMSFANMSSLTLSSFEDCSMIMALISRILVLTARGLLLIKLSSSKLSSSSSFFFPINALVSSFNPSLMNWLSEETQSMIEQQIRKNKMMKDPWIYHKIRIQNAANCAEKSTKRRKPCSFLGGGFAEDYSYSDMSSGRLPSARMTKEITRNMSIATKVHLPYLG